MNQLMRFNLHKMMKILLCQPPSPFAVESLRSVFYLKSLNVHKPYLLALLIQLYGADKIVIKIKDICGRMTVFVNLTLKGRSQCPLHRQAQNKSLILFYS